MRVQRIAKLLNIRPSLSTRHSRVEFVRRSKRDGRLTKAAKSEGLVALHFLQQLVVFEHQGKVF